MYISPFGDKNFPLDYFVGHKHGRMFCCQYNFVLHCIYISKSRALHAKEREFRVPLVSYDK